MRRVLRDGPDVVVPKAHRVVADRFLRRRSAVNPTDGMFCTFNWHNVASCRKGKTMTEITLDERAAEVGALDVVQDSLLRRMRTASSAWKG